MVSCFFHSLPPGHFNLFVSLLTVARRRFSRPCVCCLPPSRTPMDWCTVFFSASIAVFSLFVLPCPSQYFFSTRSVVVPCGAFHACTLCACRWNPRACPVRMIIPQLNFPTLGPGEAFFSFLCSTGSYCALLCRPVRRFDACLRSVVAQGEFMCCCALGLV